MKMNIAELFEKEKIFAVLRIQEGERLKNTIQALYEGGIKIIEAVIEAPETALALADIIKQKERPVIAAGGIITQRQAQIAADIGADAIISPICQMNLARLCKSSKTPLIMTAATPNEAYNAWSAGAQLIKISPSGPMGGAVYIEDILRPMKFLNVIAAGSIKIDDIPLYLKAGAKAAGLGRALYKDADYEEIERRAALACKMAAQAAI